MNRTDLANEIAAKAGLNKVAAKAALDACLESIAQALANEDKVARHARLLSSNQAPTWANKPPSKCIKHRQICNAGPAVFYISPTNQKHQSPATAEVVSFMRVSFI